MILLCYSVWSQGMGCRPPICRTCCFVYTSFFLFCPSSSGKKGGLPLSALAKNQEQQQQCQRDPASIFSTMTTTTTAPRAPAPQHHQLTLELSIGSCRCAAAISLAEASTSAGSSGGISLCKWKWSIRAAAAGRFLCSSMCSTCGVWGEVSWSGVVGLGGRAMIGLEQKRETTTKSTRGCFCILSYLILRNQLQLWHEVNTGGPGGVTRVRCERTRGLGWPVGSEGMNCREGQSYQVI